MRGRRLLDGSAKAAEAGRLAGRASGKLRMLPSRRGAFRRRFTPGQHVSRAKGLPGRLHVRRTSQAQLHPDELGRIPLEAERTRRRCACRHRASRLVHEPDTRGERPYRIPSRRDGGLQAPFRQRVVVHTRCARHILPAQRLSPSCVLPGSPPSLRLRQSMRHIPSSLHDGGGTARRQRRARRRGGQGLPGVRLRRTGRRREMRQARARTCPS